ncbi:MAG TPA: laccase domain-containing protein, partial [Solirubrobacteraceae bacterium]
MSPTPTTILDAEIVELPGRGRALFTGRAHGNLSSVGGEHAEHGLQARERLRATLGVRQLVRGYQVHGTVVGRVFAESVLEPDSGEQPTFEADGHAVAAPDFAAMVLTADCIPVVLGGDGAVAALHAGWRGLAAGVLEEGVRALREVGGRGGVGAVVGPCAGACCYEVGEEVHTAFGGAHRTLKGTPHYGGQAGDRRPIDLRAIAHARLHAAGVAEVRDVRACTICDERFFSHRREGARAG